jgi:hypothetical protein
VGNQCKSGLNRPSPRAAHKSVVLDKELHRPHFVVTNTEQYAFESANTKQLSDANTFFFIKELNIRLAHFHT